MIKKRWEEHQNLFMYSNLEEKYRLKPSEAKEIREAYHAVREHHKKLHSGIAGTLEKLRLSILNEDCQ